MGIKNNSDKSEKKTIMIIDDEESMRLLIGSYLEMDYNLNFQKDGLEAMIYLKENANAFPDLILLDMEMPNLNGRVFLRRMKIAGLQLRKIPIIFISSINIRSLVKSTLKNGAVDYIAKPFDPSELTSKVKLHLG
jgi:CheY-like chemotaxis protein